MMPKNLCVGELYWVVFRTWDNNKTVKAKRIFIGEEKRFGEIPCYVFSSRVTKRGFKSECSIPHYDLKEVNKDGLESNRGL